MRRRASEAKRPGQKRNEARPPCLDARQPVPRYSGFSIAGEVAEVRSEVGGVAPALTNFARISEPAIAQNAGTVSRYRKARISSWPQLACERGDVDAVRVELMMPS